ncbi:hypothetical protein [Gorillibacterium sp. sgz500922]|uniref:hypothetical protein n=1 Tax=Gorillibacterium sp. sgz500922 TaxID=3446694 RepID=UPI003F66366C
MRLLVSQPKHETGLEQLIREVESVPDLDAVLYPEGYVVDEASLSRLCEIAREHQLVIASGSKDGSGKDRALVIGADGNLLLERAKTPRGERLYGPSVAEAKGLRVGYLLCMEILQGFEGFNELGPVPELVLHPIGVGMFSDEQYDEWIGEARRIALRYRTAVIGTSHADGSYRNCGISLPISYWIDEAGEPVYLSKCDTRSRVLDLDKRTVECLPVA